MADKKNVNPQTDTPDSLGKLRGKINTNSQMDIRDQIQEYHTQMGDEALARQMKLKRAEKRRS